MPKTNPRRRPATQADVERAKKAAQGEAISLAMTIMFTALLDKEGFTQEDLQRLWREVNDLSDSIAQGYVSAADLRNVLRREYDVYV